MVRSDRYLGQLLILPAVGLFAILILIPLGYGLWVGFHDWNTLAPAGKFIGLGNYEQLLSSSDFWNGFINTLIFVTASTALTTLLGLGAALLLNQEFRFRHIVTAITIFPYVVPIIATTFVWRWMLNDLYGFVNYFFIALGIISSPISFLGSPDLAMPTVIFINTWAFFPITAIALLARLALIPPQFYEAARVDGASWWNQFWHITLPSLKGTLIILVLLRGIWMFTKFDSVWLLTEGGPLHRTETLPVLIYLYAFRYLALGLGSALGVILLVLIILITIVYMKFLMKY